LGQITKAPVHERMLRYRGNLVLPVVQVCDNNGSNFSGVRPR
jgi:hypothetical protein